MCIPDVAKSIGIKVFNLMSITNEARHIGWHETCMCKCRLNASACDKKQSWNKDKCRCLCEELIDNVYVIKDLLRVLIIANVNVITHVT